MKFKVLTFLLLALSFATTKSESLEFAFKDPTYSFQSLRAISGTAVGSGDIGECLVAISKIEENNDESWYEHWNRMAQQLEQDALKFKDGGNLISARSAFRRASNYYRTAEFFLHSNPEDPRIIATWEKSKNCFLEATKNLPHSVNPVKIPFENTTLPAYLCLVDSSETPRPLLIAQTGFDGTAEEVYFAVGQAAIARGYNCLIFEGPGQGEVIRIQHIPFRPNWETVITPVVDYALSLKQVDKEKIALLGISFGGFLVPRALAFEHRVKIGMCNGGVFSFHEVCMQNAPPGTEALLDDPKASKEMDESIQKMMKTDAGIRWAFGQGMYTFHAKTPSDWLRMSRPYTMNGITDKISSKMLVIDSDQDFQMKGQAKKLYDALKSPKEFMLFTAEEGAGEHCQVGAYCISNERIFDWLDKNISE